VFLWGLEGLWEGGGWGVVDSGDIEAKIGKKKYSIEGGYHNFTGS